MVKKANRLFRSFSSFFLIAAELGLYRVCQVMGKCPRCRGGRLLPSPSSPLEIAGLKTLHLFLVFTLDCPSELFFMDS